MKIADVVHAKGPEVFTVPPEVSIGTAANLMRARRIGALVVSRDGEAIDGIISERDIVCALAEDRNAFDSAVASAMTKRVITAAVDDSLTRAMAVMTQRRCRHLPVLLDGKLEGIVSIGDLVKARLEELELESRVLRDMVIVGH